MSDGFVRSRAAEHCLALAGAAPAGADGRQRHAAVAEDRDQNWSVNSASYASVNNFVDPGPDPFNKQTQRQVPGTQNLLSGASIGWALPSALTRADKDTGLFPPIPNRWLVVRHSIVTGTNAATAYAAWVIESDYQWPKKTRRPFQSDRTAAE